VQRQISHRKKSLKNRRMVAKVGMAASMGMLLYTAISRGRRNLVPHAWAGLGLVGLTIWHMTLYRRGAGSGKERIPVRRPSGTTRG